MTKQKKVILEELSKLETHPTPMVLHQIVKKKIPNISLATVYRNLDQLAKNGHILKLNYKDPDSHFDCKTDNHCHLICNKCHKICDISDVKSVDIQSEQIAKSGFTMETDLLEIYGVCKKCLINT